MQIEKNKVVSIHCKLTFDSGEIVSSFVEQEKLKSTKLPKQNNFN